jgi:hypothetical protein
MVSFKQKCKGREIIFPFQHVGVSTGTLTGMSLTVWLVEFSVFCGILWEMAHINKALWTNIISFHLLS